MLQGIHRLEIFRLLLLWEWDTPLNAKFVLMPKTMAHKKERKKRTTTFYGSEALPTSIKERRTPRA
jgi:hypothetical protein